MIPPAFELATNLDVVEQPCGLLEARVNKPASRSFNHFFGQVSGNTARYGDIGAFAWYASRAGMFTANRGRKGLSRTGRGVEDGLDTTRT
ncbi:MAG: hypothetical protein K6T57_12345 [Thermaceae bacterium]|nr:hypothetical protein [Thermaceae bacterium]